MSPLTVAVHSLLRWVVFAAGVVAAARFASGWFRGSAWTRLDDRLTLAFAVSLDVQWVVGVVLYLGVSVLGGTALASRIRLRSVALATARHRLAALSFGGAVALLLAAVR